MCKCVKCERAEAQWCLGCLLDYAGSVVRSIPAAAFEAVGSGPEVELCRVAMRAAQSGLAGNRHRTQVPVEVDQHEPAA